ncbi:MAG: hypothetical protein K1X89_21595 [Myxococcaceae bacterium]|nr:hypothetical protein [Myxococcaceae bacterium]
MALWLLQLAGDVAQVAADAGVQAAQAAADAGTTAAQDAAQALPPPSSTPGQMVGRGRLVGGWEYVWASYIVTWTGIVLYALSLWVRRPKGEAPGTGGRS